MSNWIWKQVNKDGFGYPPSGSSQFTPRLFAFDGHLYADNVQGMLFQMVDPVLRSWTKVFTPPQANSYVCLDNYLYSYGAQGLWWINQGEKFNAVNWKPVTSKGLPGDVNPTPMTTFKGNIYAVYSYQTATAKIFEIWRSKDIGTTVINWQQVVTQSFGDPQNNDDVDFMAEYNGKLYVGTNTLEYAFGVPQPTSASGSEIWESASGDSGTWTQVNIDGFGTEYTLMPANTKHRTNHVVGSWAIYKAPNQTQEYLYIGTKSHWGAEVWRYNGQGKGGWKNVTPPWAGPTPAGFSGAGRNESMTVFEGNLYLAEGFDTGNLAKYDGASWSIVVQGPNPFDPQNGGLSSLAVVGNQLYAHTIHEPFSGVTKGDQVWGYPFFVMWRLRYWYKFMTLLWKRRPILRWPPN